MKLNNDKKNFSFFKHIFFFFWQGIQEWNTIDAWQRGPGDVQEDLEHVGFLDRTFPALISSVSTKCQFGTQNSPYSYI